MSPMVGTLTFDNNVQNMERAVCERFFLEKHGNTMRPIQGPLTEWHFNQELAYFTRKFTRLLPETVPLTPVEFLQVYQGDRRYGLYERAQKSVRERPLTREDATVSAFVKGQKELVAIEPTVWVAKSDVVPRAICPRDPRFHVEYGRFIRAIEKKAYVALNQAAGYIVVAKGLNPVERANILRSHWGAFRDPVCFAADAARFESRIRRAALRWTHRWQKRCFIVQREYLSMLHSMQLDFKIVAVLRDGYVRVKIRGGMRASGDFDTGLGNTVLAVVLWLSYARKRRVRARLLSDGDDVVIVMERFDQEQFQAGVGEWFSDMGFIMEVSEPVDRFEKVRFCQCKPVCGPQGWIMIRDPIPALAKDVTSTTCLDDGPTRRAWLKAVGEGGLAIAGDMPMYGALYQSMLRAAGGVRAAKHQTLEGGLQMMRASMRGQERSYLEPSDEVRVSFWEATAIAPSDQRRYEAEARRCDWLAPLEPLGIRGAAHDALLKGCRHFPGLV